MTVTEKKLHKPLYYIARSLRIRRFILNCLPTFIVVEFLIILILVLLLR